MSNQKAVIRKWTEGLKGVVQPMGSPRVEGTFNHMPLIKLIAQVDELAAQRYEEQMKGGTLDAYRIVTTEESQQKYGLYYVSFTKGSDFPHHSHERSQASIMVIEGEGFVFLDGERYPIRAGDVVHIPPGVSHEFFVARDGERFSYLSVTEPDIILDGEIISGDAKRVAVDWKSHPSNRYTPEGSVKDK